MKITISDSLLFFCSTFILVADYRFSICDKESCLLVSGTSMESTIKQNDISVMEPLRLDSVEPGDDVVDEAKK
jgi:hypothetical protein